MKDVIKKYYGIDVELVEEYNGGIIFFVMDTYYYFVKCHYNEEYLKKIFDICSKIDNKIKLHSFVFNKDNNLLSEGYILFRLNVFIDEISVEDIKSFWINGDDYIKEYLFMDAFWEEKIDYLETQVSELSLNKLINNTFDYYVGIAEILISYLKKNFRKEKIKLCLSHKSLNTLNTIDFYNPLNITFDIYLKDIAAYIRMKNNEELLLDVVDSGLDSDYYCYFFVRMVFPFDYFYEVGDILIDGKNDLDLITIVNNLDSYEKYLWKMEKIFGIYLFSWLKKE